MQIFVEAIRDNNQPLITKITKLLKHFLIKYSHSIAETQIVVYS